MKLCRLCFVDDLIIFSEGYCFFMFMFLRVFVIFLEVLGLIVNRENLDLYESNVEKEDMSRIIEVFGFKLVKLLFRYLSIFICF